MYFMWLVLEPLSSPDNEDFQSGKETCRGRMWCLVGHCAAENEGKTGSWLRFDSKGWIKNSVLIQLSLYLLRYYIVLHKLMSAFTCTRCFLVAFVSCYINILYVLFQKQPARPISKLLNPFLRGEGYRVDVALSFTQTKIEMPKTKQSTISTFFTPQRRGKLRPFPKLTLNFTFLASTT